MTAWKPSNKVNQTHLHVYHPSLIPRFLQSHSQTSFQGYQSFTYSSQSLIPRSTYANFKSLTPNLDHLMVTAGERRGGGDAPTWSALRPHRWPPLAPCWPIASTVAHYSPVGCPTTLQYCGEDPLEERYRSVNGATMIKS